MNVASLENSKRLYELSGWEETDKSYNVENDVEDTSMAKLMHPDTIPAYSAGYLLRRLPVDTVMGRLSNGDWSFKSQTFARVAVTPEDALCSLAIKLFEEGVLK